MEESLQPAWTMTTQPDDKILVAGLFEDVNGNPRRNLAHLNSDGSLDTFFDAGVALPGFATSIALQADSNVLVRSEFISLARGRSARTSRTLRSKGSSMGIRSYSIVYPNASMWR